MWTANHVATAAWNIMPASVARPPARIGFVFVGGVAVVMPISSQICGATPTPPACCPRCRPRASRKSRGRSGSSRSLEEVSIRCSTNKWVQRCS
jgi:hypothetical protein